MMMMMMTMTFKNRYTPSSDLLNNNRVRSWLFSFVNLYRINAAKHTQQGVEARQVGRCKIPLLCQLNVKRRAVATTTATQRSRSLTVTPQPLPYLITYYTTSLSSCSTTVFLLHELWGTRRTYMKRNIQQRFTSPLKSLQNCIQLSVYP